MLGDFIDSEYSQETFSISELKEVAMCMERAAVSHNMLHLLGIDSTLEVGELKIPDGEKGGHAWLVIKGPDGIDRIFDPLNCHVIKDEAGNIIGVHPLVKKFDGSREEITATQKVLSKDKTILEQHELTYVFATDDQLLFGKTFLNR
jgi:hypothetical protein